MSTSMPVKKEWSSAKAVPDDAMLKKVKQTVGWYNRNGNLASPIIYKQAKMALEAIDPGQALEVLKGLEDKAGQIRDPTAWVTKAAARCMPELDKKVKTTLAWYNKHGGLVQQIHYDTVKTALANVSVGAALDILKGLGEKADQIKDPTWWIVGAARKLVEKKQSVTTGSFETNTNTAEAQMLDAKVLKNVVWYNKHGGLQQPIDVETVASYIYRLEPKDALTLLKGLDGKGTEVANPTNWICKAVERAESQS